MGKARGKMGIFSSNEKRRAWLELAKEVERVGVDHIPCSQSPDLFYPDTMDGKGAAYYVKIAKRACQQCPLLLQCGTYAMEFNEEYGVWGGLSPIDRKALRRRPNA
tara:strand:- start:6516 stop:6833 length:318 start_codon:yes stop_codon:yes gene_type:complete